jgi:hypothetical protein
MQPGILALRSYTIESTFSMFIWEEWASVAAEETYTKTCTEQGCVQKMIEGGVLTGAPVALVLEHVATHAHEAASQSPEPGAATEVQENPLQKMTVITASVEEGVPPDTDLEPASIVTVKTEPEPEAEPVDAADTEPEFAAESAETNMPSTATSTDTSELLCEGRVQIQFSGKGEFAPVWLSLDRDGSLICRSVSVYMNAELVHGGPKGRVLRTGSAVGCDVTVPKTARKLFDAKARKYVFVCFRQTDAVIISSHCCVSAVVQIHGNRNISAGPCTDRQQRREQVHCARL